MLFLEIILEISVCTVLDAVSFMSSVSMVFILETIYTLNAMHTECIQVRSIPTNDSNGDRYLVLDASSSFLSVTAILDFHC